jgi:hypothetical protein
MRSKFLTSFLIVYIVMLLTQHCQDFQAGSNEVASKSVASISTFIPAGSEPDSETCSPFCMCGCCGISVAHQEVTVLAITDYSLVAAVNSLPLYQSPSDSTYVVSIWQPPKV